MESGCRCVWARRTLEPWSIREKSLGEVRVAAGTRMLRSVRGKGGGILADSALSSVHRSRIRTFEKWDYILESSLSCSARPITGIFAGHNVHEGADYRILLQLLVS